MRSIPYYQSTGNADAEKNLVKVVGFPTTLFCLIATNGSLKVLYSFVGNVELLHFQVRGANVPTIHEHGSEKKWEKGVIQRWPEPLLLDLRKCSNQISSLGSKQKGVLFFFSFSSFLKPLTHIDYLFCLQG